MKIYHSGIRDKCYNFIENLYLSFKIYVKVDWQLSELFSIKKGVRQGCSLSPYITYPLMTFLINVTDMESQLVTNAPDLFADDIVLCAPTWSKLKKLLKLPSKWTRNNEMQFGINKCSSLVVWGEVSKFRNNNVLSFYLSRQEPPKTNCYTYLGV